MIIFEGCCHGQLRKIYESITKLNKEIRLVLIGGDFQAVRNEQDLNCMAVPPKYRQLQDFHLYYSGQLEAPYLTIFIGGNHEASNYLQELPYGGWVAPNIYYMGHTGMIRACGLRVAGLSGIYNVLNYDKPRHETLPYDGTTVRSVYHVRRTDIMALSLLAGRASVDVMLSHDWPAGVERYGNLNALLKKKRHFAADVESHDLGSPPAMQLLNLLQPRLWLSAHLHVRYEATVKHKTPVSSSDKLVTSVPLESSQKVDLSSKEPVLEVPQGDGKTKFLALDKCLPGRKFLEVLTIAPGVHHLYDDLSHEGLLYDPVWIAVLRAMHKLPAAKGYDQNEAQAAVDRELEWVKRNIQSFKVPCNFVGTAPTQKQMTKEKLDKNSQPPVYPNPQTQLFVDTFLSPE